ncbi:MAG: ECF-type sigma factor [Pseudomonadota bacterium]
MSVETHPLTELIKDWQSGSQSAFDQLAPKVYAELRLIAQRNMRREHPNHTLQATELVNEAFLKLAGLELDYSDRQHFFATATKIMRQLLVDYARAKHSLKRGGPVPDLTLNEQLLASTHHAPAILDLDLALDKLEAQDPRLATALEYIYFGGLTYDEAAAQLGVTRSALFEELKFAKAWLKREIG